MSYTSRAVAYFRCHGNMGYPGVNLNDAIKLADHQKTIGAYAYHRTKNYDSILCTTEVMTV